MEDIESLGRLLSSTPVRFADCAARIRSIRAIRVPSIPPRHRARPGWGAGLNMPGKGTETRMMAAAPAEGLIPHDLKRPYTSDMPTDDVVDVMRPRGWGPASGGAIRFMVVSARCSVIAG